MPGPRSFTTDLPPDNVVWLEAVRHSFPRRNRRPRLPAQASDNDPYPSLYIFPAWRTLRDSVGG